VRVGRFPMTASGKALAVGRSEGLVKVIFDADTDALGRALLHLDLSLVVPDLHHGLVLTVEDTLPTWHGCGRIPLQDALRLHADTVLRGQIEA